MARSTRWIVALFNSEVRSKVVGTGDKESGMKPAISDSERFGKDGERKRAAR